MKKVTVDSWSAFMRRMQGGWIITLDGIKVATLVQDMPNSFLFRISIEPGMQTQAAIALNLHGAHGAESHRVLYISLVDVKSVRDGSGVWITGGTDLDAALSGEATVGLKFIPSEHFWKTQAAEMKREETPFLKTFWERFGMIFGCSCALWLPAIGALKLLALPAPPFAAEMLIASAIFFSVLLALAQHTTRICIRNARTADRREFIQEIARLLEKTGFVYPRENANDLFELQFCPRWWHGLTTPNLIVRASDNEAEIFGSSPNVRAIRRRVSSHQATDAQSIELEVVPCDSIDFVAAAKKNNPYLLASTVEAKAVVGGRQ
ncbi:MAG: hypothetical protein KDK97_12440 [Verrucomicrobiales bacterium]|nr:hypothetical protein [Verrucomicrobiales bacterium]MCP5559103.1 hypothetical protein [Verrucomicrobiaceae bacterium]